MLILNAECRTHCAAPGVNGHIFDAQMGTGYARVVDAFKRLRKKS
jgi:hypothetical protein